MPTLSQIALIVGLVIIFSVIAYTLLVPEVGTSLVLVAVFLVGGICVTYSFVDDWGIQNKKQQAS